jgi:DHA1 family multidrug resistance protein-like MFS transporter
LPYETRTHNAGVPHGFFFASTLAWNFGLGMTWLAIPLYAASQGLSNAQIGAMVALPVFAQVPLNLAGGAYTDRIGGRRIVLASCCMLAVASFWFIFARGFWMLLAGQFALILSRASFWPATWTMASQLPGGAGVQLGRLNAVANFGQIAGTAACGLILAAVGFTPTFMVLAGVGLAAFLTALGTGGGKPKPAEPGRHVLAGYGPLLKRRVTYYAILCAYFSALPFTLSVSFYPLLLASYGYGEETTGMLMALRALGSIIAGLAAASFVRGGPTLWPIACGLAITLSIAFLPALNHPAPIAFWMALIGAGSGAMTLYFQLTMTDASRPEERGSALALGGLGWGVSHLTTPLIMGVLADRYGLVAGFYAVGAIAFLGVLVIFATRRWVFRQLGR